jgi:hypothetical protein
MSSEAGLAIRRRQSPTKLFWGPAAVELEYDPRPDPGR